MVMSTGNFTLFFKRLNDEKHVSTDHCENGRRHPAGYVVAEANSPRPDCSPLLARGLVLALVAPGRIRLGLIAAIMLIRDMLTRERCPVIRR